MMDAQVRLVQREEARARTEARLPECEHDGRDMSPCGWCGNAHLNGIGRAVPESLVGSERGRIAWRLFAASLFRGEHRGPGPALRVDGSGPRKSSYYGFRIGLLNGRLGGECRVYGAKFVLFDTDGELGDGKRAFGSEADARDYLRLRWREFRRDEALAVPVKGKF